MTNRLSDRLSFGEAELKRAQLFVYRPSKKALLDPSGTQDVVPCNIPQYVPSSLGSSFSLSLSSRLSSRLSSTAAPLTSHSEPTLAPLRVPWETDLRKNAGKTVTLDRRPKQGVVDNSVAIQSNTDVEERIARLEEKMASLTTDINRIIELLMVKRLDA